MKATHCKHGHLIAEFGVYDHKRGKWCRGCRKQMHRDSTAKRRKIALLKTDAIKREQGCAFCPENEPVCLDFHHMDPETKKFCISKSLQRSWETTLKEMEKCILMCSNCHRKLHLKGEI